MSAAAGDGGVRVRGPARRAGARLRDSSGQSTVEFVLVLPLLVVLTFAIVAFGIVFKEWLSVTDRARIAGRAAAVWRFTSQSPQAAVNTAMQQAGLASASATASCPGQCDPGSQVQVTVTDKLTLPSFVPFLPNPVTLTSDVTESVE